MKLVVLSVLCLLAAVHADSELNIEDGGKYNFKYSADDSGKHQREESGNGDGTVSGSYSYVDANGDLRKVEYKAGGSIGFQPTGDISVDKKTAEKAAELAELSPKAPAVETAEVKIPASPFTLPYYAIPGVHHHPHVVAPLPYTVPLQYAAPHFAHWW